jgi:hypothetical protein
LPARYQWGIAIACLIAPLWLVNRPSLRAGTAPTALPPDLTVWTNRQLSFLYGWTLDYDEQPGRVLLRLTTAFPNVGTGPIELIGGDLNINGTQDVYQRLYYSDGSHVDAFAGEFVHHPEHHHIHFEGYAEYRLREVTPGGGVGAVVGTGNKVSFCLLDVIKYNRRIPGAPSAPQYSTCNADKQGISVGWADVYQQTLPDQWIDVTDVPDGNYWLEVEVDPDDRLIESNEANNIARIRIALRT